MGSGKGKGNNFYWKVYSTWRITSIFRPVSKNKDFYSFLEILKNNISVLTSELNAFNYSTFKIEAKICFI